MAQCLIQNRTAFRAKLRLRTGGRRTGNMTGSSISLDFVLTAANAVIFHHALTGTGRIRHQSTLVPAMAERFRIICYECTAAAIAAMNGLAAIFTGGGNHMVFVLVCQSRSNIFDVPLSANRALTSGIAGIGAGSGNEWVSNLCSPLGVAVSFISPQREQISSSFPSVSQVASRIFTLCHACPREST